MYIKQNHFYDKLPGRLSEFIYNRYGYLKCVNVRTNIGDSIASFFRHSTDTFLAIEPNPHFNQYLRENWGGVTNVKILNFICSSSSEIQKYEIRENLGTASFVQTEKRNSNASKVFG